MSVDLTEQENRKLDGLLLAQLSSHVHQTHEVQWLISGQRELILRLYANVGGSASRKLIATERHVLEPRPPARFTPQGSTSA